MKAVIFDLGRVLIEYDQQRTLEALASVSRVDVQQVRTLLGSVARKMDIGAISADQFHKLMVEQAGATTDYASFESAFCSTLSRNEEALDYVSQLRRKNIKIGIISNTNAGHTGWLRRMLPELATFDDVIFSNEVGLRKPDAAIYQRSLQNLAVSPEQALFVDDIAENVEGAEAVGLHGIVHINWTKTSQQIEKRIT